MRGLILTVIDALSPTAFRKALRAGQLAVLGKLVGEADFLCEAVAAFPSVTPVCAATIATGCWQERHQVPAMCWFDREHNRFVEYGSSLRAAQRVGIAQQLTDTVYNLNRSHLAVETPTLFEQLDDAGYRTAATTFLIYRGRHRHRPRREGLGRLAAPLIRHSVLGPRELFYADLFASRRTPCSGLLGMPGLRDRHSGCAGAYLVAEDLCDFLLLSLPDNDWYSHRHGPAAQVRSLAYADRQLGRLAEALGGLGPLLERFALLVMGDHGQAPVRKVVDLTPAFAGLGLASPRLGRGEGALALCPSQRAAQLYLLEGDGGRERRLAALARRALALEGVDLAAYLCRSGPEAVVLKRGVGELRFAPGKSWRDAGGRRWELEGDLRALGLRRAAETVESVRYPAALERLWAALCCLRSGDLLLSAAPGCEFLDLGGAAHQGGGSHGSLRAEDSLTTVVGVGIGTGTVAPRTIAHVAGIVRRHFGLC